MRTKGIQIKCTLHLVFHCNVEVGNKLEDEEDGHHEGHPQPKVAV